MDHTHAGEPAAADPGEAPVSISHIVHTLQKYAGVIILTLLTIMLGYVLLAVMAYLMAPAVRVTSLPFRVDFEGAARGMYPNGRKFSGADVITTPILLAVYRKNEIQSYAGWDKFAASLVVVESNRAAERLALEYQARLADPKLSPVDRDRLQDEYESKRQSLSKNEYALQFITSSDTAKLPDAVTKKVLADVLDEWARFAAQEQRVLQYRIAVVSPNILRETAHMDNDPLMALQVLRSQVKHVVENIHELARLPGSEVARTPTERLSLQELEIRLDEMQRFRLEPLMRSAAGLTADRTAAMAFLEQQLAYDERRLAAAQASVNTIRTALATYSGVDPSDHGQLAATSTSGTSPNGRTGATAATAETVMPQLSEGFMDRIISLTSRAADAEYRQDLVIEYRKAASALIPVEQAVLYDRQVLDLVRTAPTASRVAADGIRQELAGIRQEVRTVIERVNELYLIISRNLNPAQTMYTVTNVATTRIQRNVSVPRLILYGVVLLLISIPVVIIACLLHNRIREEEAAEHRTPVIV